MGREVRVRGSLGMLGREERMRGGLGTFGRVERMRGSLGARLGVERMRGRLGAGFACEEGMRGASERASLAKNACEGASERASAAKKACDGASYRALVATATSTLSASKASVRSTVPASRSATQVELSSGSRKRTMFRIIYSPIQFRGSFRKHAASTYGPRQPWVRATLLPRVRSAARRLESRWCASSGADLSKCLVRPFCIWSFRFDRHSKSRSRKAMLARQLVFESSVLDAGRPVRCPVNTAARPCGCAIDHCPTSQPPFAPPCAGAGPTDFSVELGPTASLSFHRSFSLLP